MTAQTPELIACTPTPIDPLGFNSKAVLPYDLTTAHIGSAMTDFLKLLGFINIRLNVEKIPRLESIMMPANFSSLVGEFMNSRIPEHCKTLVKNRFHNGHPDLIPSGMFGGDAVQYATDGIEIKASRYARSWQGHNPEAIWLMVFVYDSNRAREGFLNPKPFQFLMVAGAQLTKRDWKFAGRKKKSRRTITASVTKSGYTKVMANWIYKLPTVNPAQIVSAAQADPQAEEAS